MKLLFAPAGFNLIKARTVKGHYRQLSNGRIVYIDQHFDKRSQAKQKPKNFTNRVVHADEHSTTTVNAEGRQIVHKHNPSKQMSNEDIYNHLNSVLPVDYGLAFKVWMERHNIDDYGEYLKHLLANEKQALNPRFETLKDAEKWIDKNQISKVQKELKSHHGDTTTYTEAFLHRKDDSLRNHLMGTDDSSDYDQARSQMLQEHAEDARNFAGQFKKEVDKAKKLGAEDCPVVQGLSPHIQFFGHQAEALAKLNVLTKAVVDVDMGGGKGLLLPADAMNLMAKGEVKRPLIIVPTQTLDQNAKLTVENYTEGRVNVFKMDNRTLKKEFGGDIEAMMEAVEQAPPNTIFMAGYDFVSANHGADKNDPSTHFPNAQALSGMSFDYVACFPKGTKVFTLHGYRAIETIEPGDVVLSAKGWSTVYATHSKLVDRIVRIKLSNGSEITCSDNHPFLTENGWTRADALTKEVKVYTIAEVLRILQKIFFNPEAQSEKKSFLFKELFSELQSIPARVQGEKTGGMGEIATNRPGEVCEDFKYSCNECKKESGENGLSSEQIFVEARIQTASAPKSWGQWLRANSAGIDVIRCFGKRMGMELPSADEPIFKERCLSDLLQIGFSPCEIENLCGSGWTESSFKERAGSEKRRVFDTVRVESVEIEELPNSGGCAKRTFYDLSVDGHPSFVVEGLLVHNCDESHRIKTTQTARFKAIQYLSKAKYKRVASGTFISNNPIDAIGQLKFLHPNIKWDDEAFKEEYGYEETEEGKSWSRDGTKKLREDLQNLGLISIRRSAWINKLPKRDEQLSIVKPDKLLEGVYETALDDVISQLLDDKKLDSGADLLGDDEDGEITPQFMAKFNALQAISDYPDRIAEMIESALDVIGGERKAKKATKLTDEEKADLAAEEIEAVEMLQKFSPATRAALRTLKDKVSPKALDVYKKMEEHFKNPKNGKFIIFCQRKLSAQHILDHMPDHLKQKALYYDANKKAELKEWATDPKGPQILVAVDASITEGVNLQIANGMYRYDHHYSPGTQEQSYARIWRPGQEKAVNIHLGIVDQTMDVTKVARMISKLHTNMMVTSDMDDDETFTAYRLNIDNIRNNRSANILPAYMGMGKKILDFQKDEGKLYDKRYKGEKDGKYPRGNDAPLGGAQAKEMHGMPGYQEYAGGVVGSGFIDDDSKDQLLGHFRDYIRKNMKGKKHLVYDREIENAVFPHVVALAERHNASASKKQEVQKPLLNAYANEYKKTTGEDLSENIKNAAHHAVSAWATGKKAPPHTSDADHEGAITAMDEHLSMDMTPKEKKVAGQTLKELLGALGSKKLKHVGQGMVENPEIAEAFWKKRAKDKGYDLPDDVKDTLMGAAALIHENQGGYKAVKHYVEDEE
jgi:hypothetical protein